VNTSSVLLLAELRSSVSMLACQRSVSRVYVKSKLTGTSQTARSELGATGVWHPQPITLTDYSGTDVLESSHALLS